MLSLVGKGLSLQLDCSNIQFCMKLQKVQGTTINNTDQGGIYRGIPWVSPSSLHYSMSYSPAQQHIAVCGVVD